MTWNFLTPRGIVIIWESSSGSSSGPRTYPFEVVPKAPAGQRDSRPEFSIYLGVNTGPYNTTENGTLILPPIPIEWIVAPRPTNPPSITTNSSSPGTSVVDLPIQCPTRSENLRLFGLTNLIVALLIVFTACRPLIRITTGGILGGPGKWSKYYIWLISMALTIGSNALVSRLIVTTPGYEHLSMLNVFALYSSRPRINQVWTGFLRVLRYGGRKWGTGNKKTELGEEIENKKAGEGLIPEEDDHVETEWIYTDSYVATSVAEFVIQLVSAIFIGITWRRFPNQPIREHMEDYYNYMLAAPAMSLVGWLLIPIWRKRNRGGWDRTDISGRTDVSGRTGVFVFVLFLGFSGFFTYGVAWRYWAEFLLLPGSLWCPPKFVEQAAVWSSFSALSAFFGALL
ncbi:hypothetical protein V8F33_009908 [Rhypophila sp. PSN 637]